MLIGFSQLAAKKWAATSLGVFDTAKIFHEIRQEGVNKKAIRSSCFVAIIGKMFYIQCRTIKILGFWLALGSNNL
jgi:hypothetical protein|tara:strand:- start:2852 stop:3076 length:225 start_codon:yes stop_codon:yes gene_type:complete